MFVSELVVDQAHDAASKGAKATGEIMGTLHLLLSSWLSSWCSIMALSKSSLWNGADGQHPAHFEPQVA